MSTPNPQPPTPKGYGFDGRWWFLVFGFWGLGDGSSGAQAPPVVLENEHVRVTRNAALCGSPKTPGCADRVLVALADLNVRTTPNITFLRRGDAIAFDFTKSYSPPPGEFLEVTIKPDRPPAKLPPVAIAPDKNSIVHDGRDYFVFEEKLEPGDTRERHSHAERVVIVINRTRLQQWPDGAPMLFRDQIPDDVRFNPPVVHVVKTVGNLPLRNIVIEFKR